MRQLRETIGRVARSDSVAIILGESGTGKELVARAIHAASPRSHEPFVAVNCGAISPDLMQSELFGHERGAFTGAHAARQGRFEAAGRGTLFLDEIAEMSPAMQVKLLRVLQERAFERVGSNTPRPLLARVVAATHCDLPRLMSEGLFREDLYYRLCVVPITVPPLRERGDDICLLARHALDQLSARGALPVRFDPGVREALLGYAWPGNVRELMNLMERLSVLHAGGTIRVDDLPEPMRGLGHLTPWRDRAEQPAAASCVAPAPVRPLAHERGLQSYLDAVERQAIVDALRDHRGVIARAAFALGMPRTTLIERMRRLGVTREAVALPCPSDNAPVPQHRVAA